MSHITQHTLKTSNGFELSLLNYGARVHSINFPLGAKKINLALGYQKLEDYLSDEFYMGATVGRFCNRIHGGKVSFNNQTFNLPMNDTMHANTLHGGAKGFDKCFWETLEQTEQSIKFRLHSPHLDQGFPGNLDVWASYSVEDLGFSVEYSAICDQETIVNLCNHSYFNLDGFDNKISSNITNLQLLLAAKQFLPLTENKVPNGKIQSVVDTPFNFLDSHANSRGKAITQILESKHPQIELAGGLDHTFVNDNVNDGEDGKKLRLVAQLYSKKTNIAMSVSSSQSALHVYTGNYLNHQFSKHAGICFETQGFTDSPNHENFPTALLRAGEVYSHKTIYKFSLC